MMRTYLAGSEQCLSPLTADGDIQQTITVKVTKFAAVPINEFGTSKAVRHHANSRQTQSLKFQSLHCSQTAPSEKPRGSSQKGVEEVGESRHSSRPAQVTNDEVKHTRCGPV